MIPIPEWLNGDDRLQTIVDYRCPSTLNGGYHYRVMTRVIGYAEKVRETCEMCGATITAIGHRWATVMFVIHEQETIEDVLNDPR